MHRGQETSEETLLEKFPQCLPRERNTIRRGTHHRPADGGRWYRHTSGATCYESCHKNDSYMKTLRDPPGQK